MAALHPGSSERIKATTSLNVPHAVRKSSELISAFTDAVLRSFLGYDKSCIIRILSEWGLGLAQSAMCGMGR